MAEPLTGLESWLWARGSSWQVATVFLLKGQVTRSEIACLLSDRLAYAPRWRRVIRSAVLGAQWVDDADFDIDCHVREVPVPDLAGLSTVVADLLESELPPGAAPWEAVVVPSGPRRTAVIVRVAPALVDGYDHIHLLQEALDTGPVEFPEAVAAWTAEPEAQADLMADAWSSVVRGIRQPRRVLARAQANAGLLVDEVARAVTPVVQPRQRVGSTEVAIDRLRQIRLRHRVSTHDVVMAAVTGGYAAWLQAMGQPLVDKVAQVPLATREADVLGSAIGCRIAPQWIALPVGLTDPLDRLHLIASLTRARIDSGRLVSARDLTTLAGFAPPTLATVGAGTVAAGRPWDILVTNVPGPGTGRSRHRAHHLVSPSGGVADGWPCDRDHHQLSTDGCI